MRNFFRQNFQHFFRAAFLIGVLAGLLFSSGEGIRLFPFPAFENARNENSRLNNGRETDYEENAFRFEKGESSLSKFQRVTKDYWAGSFNAPQKSPSLKTAIIFQTDLLQNPGVFNSQIVPLSLGSRAPPFS